MLELYFFVSSPVRERLPECAAPEHFVSVVASSEAALCAQHF